MAIVMRLKVLFCCFYVALMFVTAPAFATTKYVNGIDSNYPPFAYIDRHGKAAGFDVDSMNWIAEKMGFTVEHRPMAWDGIISALQSQKIDMICSGMSINEERKRQVNFSEPYWNVNEQDYLGVAVRKGDTVLLETLNKGYELLKQDPYWQELMAKYNLTPNSSAISTADTERLDKLRADLTANPVKSIADGFRGIPWGISEKDAVLIFGLEKDVNTYLRKSDNNSIGNVSVGIRYDFSDARGFYQVRLLHSPSHYKNLAQELVKAFGNPTVNTLMSIQWELKGGVRISMSPADNQHINVVYITKGEERQTGGGF